MTTPDHRLVSVPAHAIDQAFARASLPVADARVVESLIRKEVCRALRTGDDAQHWYPEQRRIAFQMFGAEVVAIIKPNTIGFSRWAVVTILTPEIVANGVKLRADRAEATE